MFICFNKIHFVSLNLVVSLSGVRHKSKPTQCFRCEYGCVWPQPVLLQPHPLTGFALPTGA